MNANPAGLMLTRSERRRSIVAAVAGNFVEFYDWTIYAFMAPILANRIFPSDTPGMALLLAFSSISLAYVARPIGALLFGFYGDRLGRRNAMTVAILLMAASSTLIGCTPTHDQIGFMAPTLIVVARFLQGIAAGGEGGNANAYLAEIAKPENRGFTSSFQQFSTGLSSVFAIFVAGVLSWTLTPETLEDWGWRIPFLLGGVLGLAGLYLRRRAEETPAFEAHRGEEQNMVASLLGEWRAIARTIGAAVLPSFAYLSWQAMLPAYIAGTTGLSRSDTLTIGLIGIAVFVTLVLPAGWLSDRVGRKPMMIGFALASLLWSYPTFIGLPTFLRSFEGALLVSVVGNAILGSMAGSLVAVLTEQFDTRVRVTGNGLAYAIAVVISGATLPPILATAISEKSYHFVLGYFIVAALVSLVTYVLMRETRTRDMYR